MKQVMSECTSSFGCIELGVFGDPTSELLLSVLATQPINIMVSVLLCLF